MPRRYSPQKREVQPDPKYKSVDVSRFVNQLMRDGKKSTARRVMYDALALVEERMKRDPLEVFQQAMQNATPRIEVRPRRVGGATYQVPIEVDAFRARSLASRWLIAAADARGPRRMAEKLAQEFMDASQGQGAAVKRKDEMHRMADANRTFAHYRY